MLDTVRVDYLNDKTADQVLAAIDGVLLDVRTKGVTDQELANAKNALKSAFFEDLEGGGLPRFGRANLLGAFALFDDDPGRINTILQELDKVTVADVRAAAARWLVPTNRTTLDSRPAAAAASPGGGR
jgi:predicted Zn-dependent peptidase